MNPEARATRDPIRDAKLQLEIREMLRAHFGNMFERWFQLVAERRANDGMWRYQSIQRADADELREMLLAEQDRLNRKTTL